MARRGLQHGSNSSPACADLGLLTHATHCHHLHRPQHDANRHRYQHRHNRHRQGSARPGGHGPSGLARASSREIRHCLNTSATRHVVHGTAHSATVSRHSVTDSTLANAARRAIDAIDAIDVRKARTQREQATFRLAIANGVPKGATASHRPSANRPAQQLTTAQQLTLLTLAAR